jgi:hypothetical protein
LIVPRATKAAGLVAALALAACGGGGTSSGASGAGTISGDVKTTSWTKLTSAYWIGKNMPGGPAMTLFLFEAPVACADIVNLNWDKTATGAHQLVEIGVLDTAPKTYTVMTDVVASYLYNNYNPDAFSGTVTIESVTPMVNVTGSFDLTFSLAGATPVDRLMGTFDAAYCADGTEP